MTDWKLKDDFWHPNLRQWKLHKAFGTGAARMRVMEKDGPHGVFIAIFDSKGFRQEVYSEESPYLHLCGTWHASLSGGFRTTWDSFKALFTRRCPPTFCENLAVYRADACRLAAILSRSRAGDIALAQQVKLAHRNCK